MFRYRVALRLHAFAARGGADVAFRDGGPFLVGKGAWLTRMMDAAEGRVPSMADAGVNRFICRFGSMDQTGQVRRFARDVLPAVENP